MTQSTQEQNKALVPSSTLRYEAGLVVAEGDFVIAHGRVSGWGNGELDRG